MFGLGGVVCKIIVMILPVIDDFLNDLRLGK